MFDVGYSSRDLTLVGVEVQLARVQLGDIESVRRLRNRLNRAARIVMQLEFGRSVCGLGWSSFQCRPISRLRASLNDSVSCTILVHERNTPADGELLT